MTATTTSDLTRAYDDAAAVYGPTGYTAARASLGTAAALVITRTGRGAYVITRDGETVATAVKVTRGYRASIDGRDLGYRFDNQGQILDEVARQLETTAPARETATTTASTRRDIIAADGLTLGYIESEQRGPYMVWEAYSGPINGETHYCGTSQTEREAEQVVRDGADRVRHAGHTICKATRNGLILPNLWNVIDDDARIVVEEETIAVCEQFMASVRIDLTPDPEPATPAAPALPTVTYGPMQSDRLAGPFGVRGPYPADVMPAGSLPIGTFIRVWIDNRTNLIAYDGEIVGYTPGRFSPCYRVRITDGHGATRTGLGGDPDLTHCNVNSKISIALPTPDPDDDDDEPLGLTDEALDALLSEETIPYDAEAVAALLDTQEALQPLTDHDRDIAANGLHENCAECGTPLDSNPAPDPTASRPPTPDHHHTTPQTDAEWHAAHGQGTLDAQGYADDGAVDWSSDLWPHGCDGLPVHETVRWERRPGILGSFLMHGDREIGFAWTYGTSSRTITTACTTNGRSVGEWDHVSMDTVRDALLSCAASPPLPDHLEPSVPDEDDEGAPMANPWLPEPIEPDDEPYNWETDRELTRQAHGEDPPGDDPQYAIDRDHDAAILRQLQEVR